MFIAKKHLNRGEGMISTSAISNFKGNIIDLSIGDIDSNTSDIIIKSAFEDVLNGHTHYTHPKGALELRSEISKYHRDNFTNYNIHPDNIFVVSGGCHGMYLALHSILDPEDEVIIFAPYFPVYKEQIELSQGIPVVVNLKEENGFQLDMKDLESAISSKTKAIIINTPSNPTGVCYNIESLNIIRDIAIKHNLLVLADDIYDFYSYSEPFIPIYTLPNMAERTVSICSFSKNFAMTGWRIGYITGPSDIVNCASSINESIVYSTSTPSQRGALAALKNFKSVKESLVHKFNERVDFFYDKISEIPFISCVKPQGGIYIFLNIAKTGLTSNEFANRLFQECGVKVIPGNIFGSDKHIRISLIVDEVALAEVCSRISKFKF